MPLPRVRRTAVAALAVSLGGARSARSPGALRDERCGTRRRTLEPAEDHALTARI